MPLYVCNAKAGAISDEAKALIAKDITDIHCELTGAPPSFVHAFFFEDAERFPLKDKQALLVGQIRAGRNDAQKGEIIDRMSASIHRHASIPRESIGARLSDTQASWVMEGGDVLPEPGDEADWLVAHEAKAHAQ